MTEVSVMSTLYALIVSWVIHSDLSMVRLKHSIVDAWRTVDDHLVGERSHVSGWYVYWL